MTEGENSGGRHSRLAADPTGPHDFDEVLRAELREILPELAVPADARATIQTIDACATDLAALCLSGGGVRSATFALGLRMRGKWLTQPRFLRLVLAPIVLFRHVLHFRGNHCA